MIENTPWLIERYRSQTVALDYYGDSVINSVSDTLFMVLGFLLARWWPVWLTVAVTIPLEVVVGYMIRDNLTLNVLMLLWPVQSILDWQAGDEEWGVVMPAKAGNQRCVLFSEDTAYWVPGFAGMTAAAKAECGSRTSSAG